VLTFKVVPSSKYSQLINENIIKTKTSRNLIFIVNTFT
jgi:hypothetical protein